MSDPRDTRITERLRQLQLNSPDVEAASLHSVDGLAIASYLPADVEEDRIAAMSAAMHSLGERISSELGRGGLQQVYIKGKSGYVLLTAVGEEAVLTILARADARLGLLLLDIRHVVTELERILNSRVE
ncbi:MAG TPA: roadblock/LC7 domain-containing protein [Anaerolineales bacterium]|nr:roadblock/LC7 domain-containing protein [Anaerolineales bacterium]